MSVALMPHDDAPPPAAQAPSSPAERVVVTFAVYRAPTGAPAPFMVVRWRAIQGQPRSLCDEPVYAASIDSAKGVAPPGLTWSEPKNRRGKSLLVTIGRERK